MKTFNDFTKIYPLSKTLRFELVPIGRTRESIIQSGILEQDQHRADSYVKVKKIIDEYHKAFIETVLSGTQLTYSNTGKYDSLEEYYVLYMCGTKDEKQNALFEKVQDNLRKQLADSFKKNDSFKRIDKQELFKEDLVNFVKTEEEQELISEFNSFTTYFTGYHENRKNMYVADKKSTAIAYRLIHENLPRFINNMTVFEKIAVSPVANELNKIYSDFEEYLNINEIAEMFKLDYFNEILTQKQIDVYNLIIGGKTFENGKKIKGLNEYINLYNQQQKDKSNRLPKLKPLYKLILSDKEAFAWIEKFDSDEEVLVAIKQVYDELSCNVINSKAKGEHSLKEILICLKEYNLDKIYIKNDQQLTDISQRIFGSYGVISKCLVEDLKKEVIKKKKETYEEYEERCTKILKSQKSISLATINNSMRNHAGENIQTIEDYFATLGAVETDSVYKEDLFKQIESAYTNAKNLLNTPYPKEKNITQDKIAVELIKDLLDSIKNLQRFVKPLLGEGNEADKDERFYGEFTALWNELDKITPLYNMVRNHVTKKPYSTNKIKLNFKNPTLLKGWDVNKESDNTAVILRKNGLYYLAIMDKKHNRVFETKDTLADGDCYEKMDYKLLPGANKMLPKVFFSKKNIEEYSPSEQLLENYNNDTHKKGETFNLDDCHNLIDFFKSSINKHKDWSNFNFHFSDTVTYSDISAFYREVEQQGYKITFRNISAAYIDSFVAEGKIYLFQIYNKDFSPNSKGTPNLHTLYWKMLFDERNLGDVVYKLNGEAEVFFRESSIKHEHPTHPANQPIANKNPLNKKKQSCFEYDLIKDKRYTVDKFQLHIPITINFKSTGNDNINNDVNEFIKQNNNLHIIGIDRGERHLLYLTMIDLRGNIVKQHSLNEIVNTHKEQEYRTDYHQLLSKREDERMQARQSWQAIENIKELKEGYLSAVIHKIAELMVKYKAIVVLEDLNQGFMRGRQKVEAAVYQKFEKMLIDKLNYLADKKKDPQEVGGVLNAYQLTNKFDSFKKMGKQCGFLFYTPAWNTSKIDPVTGFVNLFDTRYESRDKAREFFNKFIDIRHNCIKGWFEFEFDYAKFTTKAEDTRTHWTVCSIGKRIINFRDEKQNSQWKSKEIELTDCFKNLFAEYNINLDCNLKENITKQDDAKFFKSLLGLFKLTLQMRNSEIGTAVDYLQSPVADECGRFYNSCNCESSLPENADANGAYNIARKGLWMVQQIKKTTDVKKLKLAISNKEWLQFAQDKPYTKA